MTRKEAFHRKTKFSLYNRNLVREWEADYTKEQLDYLFAHGYLQDSLPMIQLGENPNDKYYEFTNKGAKWEDWYSCTLWEYIKYYVINVGWWRYKWQNFRISCGHHYDWQDYEGVDINNI